MTDQALEQKVDKILDKLNREVIPAIADVRSDIRDGNTRREEIIKDIEEVKTAINKHDNVLYGNGKTGVITNLRSITDWIEAHKWYERIFVAALTGEAIAIIFALILK